MLFKLPGFMEPESVLVVSIDILKNGPESMSSSQTYLSPEFFKYTIRDGTEKQRVLITTRHDKDMDVRRKEEQMKWVKNSLAPEFHLPVIFMLFFFYGVENLIQLC